MDNEQDGNVYKKYVVVSLVIFFVLVTFVYSFYKIIKWRNGNNGVIKNNLDTSLQIKQAELNKMNMELDKVRDERGVAETSTTTVKKETANMDALRKNSLKQQKSNSTTTIDQSKYLDSMHTSTTNN